MTKKELEKMAVLVSESDQYDGFIYISTEKIYYYKNQLFASMEYANATRYSGKNYTHVFVDNVRKNLEQYGDRYWNDYLQIDAETLEKIKEIVKKEDAERNGEKEENK